MSLVPTPQTPRLGMVTVMRKPRPLVTSVEEFQTRSGEVSRRICVPRQDTDGRSEALA